MADKIFRPRRGMKATAVRKGIILKKGELFFEVPDSGVGTGRSKVKLGDGVKTYDELPYAIDPDDCSIKDLATTLLSFTLASSKSSDEALLADIKSGNDMATIMSSIEALLKRLVAGLETEKDKTEELSKDLSDETSKTDQLIDMLFHRCLETQMLTESGEPLATESGTNINVEVIL